MTRGSDQEQAQRTSPGARLDWMDRLRGASVLLVVLYHAAFEVASSAGYTSGPVTAFNSAVAPFRMPTMVFLSGLLLHRSIAKGARSHVDGKLRKILWPFVVWSVVYLAASYLSSRVAGAEDDGLPLNFFLHPPAVLWFLQYLLVFYLTALLWARLPWQAQVGLVAASFAVAAFVAPRLFILFGFFVLGHLAGSYATVWRRLLGAPQVVAVAGLLTAVSVVLAARDAATDARYDASQVPLVLGGVVLLSWAAARIPAGSLAAVSAAGRHSLVIFLTHWLFINAAVDVTLLLDPGVPGGVLLALAVLVGVLGPVVVIATLGRWPVLNWLFSWGAKRREAQRLPE